MERDEVNVALESMADDYIQYLKMDITNERSKVEADIDCMMRKLEELQSTLEIISVDTTLCLYTLVPSVIKKYQDMQPIFQQIDKLETIVKVVSKNVIDMEQQLDEAEEILPPESPLKTFFKPIFGRKSGPTTPVRSREYNPLPVFSTAELFKLDEKDGK